MKILFCARHFGTFRNYESAIRGLAWRGHDVHLAGDVPDVLGGQALVERLAAAYPSITWSMAPGLEGWRWRRLTELARNGLEAVRFADPAYDQLPKYRHRSMPKAPWLVVKLTRNAWGRRLAAAVLRCVERGIPTPVTLCAWMRAHTPDVVLLASVTNDGAPQMDHLKAAQALGLPTSLPVYSWDHLSGKAVLHIWPSQVLVWNETQRREAVELHGLPPERVVVTGAYGYEQWMSWKPSMSRAAFCTGCGFDQAAPVLVYVCSVLSRPAPPEAPFILAWIRALRGSGIPTLRQAGILIRPHPERLVEWDHVSFADLGPVALRGRNPIDPDAKGEYFNTLHFATAVVGIVTSAFVEAAVVGCPSLAIEQPEFREHQDGAPHYHYLRDPVTGLLLTATDLEAHVIQLATVVEGNPEALRRTAAFVDRFVRPPVGQASASAAFVSSIEGLADNGAVRPSRFGGGFARIGAELLFGVDHVPGVQRLLWNAHDRAVDAREEEVRQGREGRVARRDAHQAQEALDRSARGRVKRERVRERRIRVETRERDRAALKALRQRERGRRQRQREGRARARQAERTRGALRRRWRAIWRWFGIGK